MVYFTKRQREKIRKCKLARAFACYALCNMYSDFRDYWVNPFNDDCDENSEFLKMYKRLRDHPKEFYGIYRMDVPQFDQLLEMLQPDIEKKTSNFRWPVSGEEQLVITLM